MEYFVLPKLVLLLGILFTIFQSSSATPFEKDFIAEEKPNESFKVNAVRGASSRSKNESQILVVGGRSAKEGEFPYQVSLRSTQTGEHFCGGSIISPTHILTAAHCVPKKAPSDLFAVVGTNYLNYGGSGFAISQITIHEQYTPQNHSNDIAVLRVRGYIGGAEKIKSIGLSPVDPKEGTKSTLSGWGLTSHPSTVPPNDLQCIELKTISIKECQQRLPAALGKQIKDGHVCTHMPAGQGGCMGDSGGPLVAGGSQIGIVSFGIPCAKGYPDVFTSVAYYRNWIYAKIGSLV